MRRPGLDEAQQKVESEQQEKAAENLVVHARPAERFDQRSVDSDIGFATTIISNFIAPSAVPEPASWAMMLLGFGAIGYSMRRRRISVRLAELTK